MLILFTKFPFFEVNPTFLHYSVSRFIPPKTKALRSNRYTLKALREKASRLLTSFLQTVTAVASSMQPWSNLTQCLKCPIHSRCFTYAWDQTRPELETKSEEREDQNTSIASLPPAFFIHPLEFSFFNTTIRSSRCLDVKEHFNKHG